MLGRIRRRQPSATRSAHVFAEPPPRMSPIPSCKASTFDIPLPHPTRRTSSLTSSTWKRRAASRSLYRLILHRSTGRAYQSDGIGCHHLTPVSLPTPGSPESEFPSDVICSPWRMKFRTGSYEPALRPCTSIRPALGRMVTTNASTLHSEKKFSMLRESQRPNSLKPQSTSGLNNTTTSAHIRHGVRLRRVTWCAAVNHEDRAQGAAGCIVRRATAQASGAVASPVTGAWRSASRTAKPWTCTWLTLTEQTEC